MAELDELESMAHELKELQTINLVCENIIHKLKDIQKKQKVRTKQFSDRLDMFASHKNICDEDCCPHRIKYKPNVKDDDGSWI